MSGCCLGLSARTAHEPRQHTARIAEAQREGWRGEAENLSVSLAHVNDKLAQLDLRARSAATINLGIPTFGEITGRTASPPLPTRPATDLATAT